MLIEFKFHHTMLVLNAFVAISEGLVSDNQGSFQGIKNRNAICIWRPFMRCLVPAMQPQDTGAPNNLMFPNTPEVSQMVFSVL